MGSIYDPKTFLECPRVGVEVGVEVGVDVRVEVEVGVDNIMINQDFC